MKENSENFNEQVVEPFTEIEPQKRPKNYQLISLILAVWGIILSFFPYFSVICVLLGFSFFIKGAKLPKKTTYRWALSLNILSAILTIVFFIVYGIK